MIELKQIGNEYYLNGVRGDYSTLSKFNYNGKYKQKSFIVTIEKGRICYKWTFYGNLKQGE
jgi:hypothetical protein